uniref:prickle-like protein 2 isoform X1 n=1 Tax=Myxine glutinosa TaxID=7769 RepID=UPI00358FE121
MDRQMSEAFKSGLQAGLPGLSHSKATRPTILQTPRDVSRLIHSDEDSGCVLEEYAWIPPGLRPEQVYQFFSSLPEEKVPFLGSVGEQDRLKQLLQQLPPHDSEVQYCQVLDEEERKEQRLFNIQRMREAMGQGTALMVPHSALTLSCQQCSQVVGVGKIAVFTSRAGPQACWHPGCFVCTTCRELLVDLIYFYQERNVYCGRHHAELLKPRCAACDEIIFADECTEAEGRHWHTKHFCCQECACVLGGQRYVMKDGQPFCCFCFQTMCSDMCAACGKLIGIDQGQMMYAGQHWHANEICFSCAQCHTPLLGQPFLPCRDQIFCSKPCSSSPPGSTMGHSHRPDDAEASDSSDSAFQSGRSRDSRLSSAAMACKPVAKNPNIRQPCPSPQTMGLGFESSSEVDPETYSGGLDMLSLQMDTLSLASQPMGQSSGHTWTSDEDFGLCHDSADDDLNIDDEDRIIGDRPTASSHCSTASTEFGVETFDRVRRYNVGSETLFCLLAEEKGLTACGTTSGAASLCRALRQRWQSPESVDSPSLAAEFERTRLTSHDSVESLSLSTVTGLSGEGQSRRHEGLSKFSIPDLSKDSGMNGSEKMSNMGTLNSSIRGRSSDSLQSIGLPLPHQPSVSTPNESVVPIDSRSSGSTPLPLTEKQAKPGVATSRLGPIDHGISVVPTGHFYADVHIGDVESGRNDLPQSVRTPRRSIADLREEGVRPRRHRRHRSRRARSDNALHLTGRRPATARATERRLRHNHASLAHRSNEIDWHAMKPSSFAQGKACYPRAVSTFALQPEDYLRNDNDFIDTGWCSTCSSSYSSSDSEEEGFFLGEPIPRPPGPGQFAYSLPQSTRPCSTIGRQRSKRRKNCIIS